MRTSIDPLLREIRACRLCAAHLPLGPRPVLQAAADARVLIVGQAPGKRVHESGVPFDDASGDRLRDWMGVGRDVFYDPHRVAIVPMGFCYPGTGSGGDRPPRPECAPTWHPRLLPLLHEVRLTLVIGQYAQAALLDTARGASLTDAVRAWRTHLEHGRLPLPHPSPRNNRWLKRNPWFADDLLPVLRERVAAAFG